MSRQLTDLEMLTELEPVAAANVNRHESVTTDWNPHDYVPWDRGRNFARSGGTDWSPEQLLSVMYILHFMVVRKRLFLEGGGLRHEYVGFLERFQPLAARQASSFPLDIQFALRFAVVLAFLEVAWKDPELPASMLPPQWPGVKARCNTYSRSLLCPFWT